MTQTVVGLPSDFRPFGGSAYQLDVSTTRLAGSGKDWTQLNYAASGTLRPGDDRVLRLSWLSPSCFDEGAVAWTDTLAARVRVGAFTRTENIDIMRAMALDGTGHCGSS